MDGCTRPVVLLTAEHTSSVLLSLLLSPLFLSLSADLHLLWSLGLSLYSSGPQRFQHTNYIHWPPPAPPLSFFVSTSPLYPPISSSTLLSLQIFPQLCSVFWAWIGWAWLSWVVKLLGVYCWPMLPGVLCGILWWILGISLPFSDSLSVRMVRGSVKERRGGRREVCLQTAGLTFKPQTRCLGGGSSGEEREEEEREEESEEIIANFPREYKLTRQFVQYSHRQRHTHSHKQRHTHQHTPQGSCFYNSGLINNNITDIMLWCGMMAGHLFIALYFLVVLYICPRVITWVSESEKAVSLLE